MLQVIRRSGRARVPAITIIGVALVGALLSASLPRERSLPAELTMQVAE